MQQVGEKRCEVETNLQQHVGELQQSLDASTASQEHRVRTLQEGAAAHLKAVQEEMEVCVYVCVF